MSNRGGRPGPTRLSAFVPASVVVPSGAGMAIVAGVCGLVSIGMVGATATIVLTLVTRPDAPAALWAPAALTALIAVVVGFATVRLVGAPRRLRRLSAVLDGATLTVHDGLKDRVRSMDLHGPGVEIATRRDMARRQRFQVIRPRLLTELIAPASGGGRAALLLVDTPGEGAAAGDPPARALPRGELRTLAAVLAASPNADGRRAASVVTTMLG